MTTDQYNRLHRQAIERGRDRLVAAQPELGRVYCFHLAGNWGNEAARRELARSNKLTHYITQRSDREYRIQEHKEHILRSENGIYRWCDACQGRKIRYRA